MLLDTSGLFHLMNATEPRHAEAMEFYRAADVRLTHSYVLAELVALATTRGVDRSSLLRYVDELVNEPEIEIRWIDEAEVRAGIALLERRRDKKYSLCDAISFVLMRERNISEALTTDHHFEQEGFRRLLPNDSKAQPMYHWRGYWEQFGMGRQPMEDLVLSLQDGAVRGRGRDIIGLFTFVGQMDAAGRLAMEKQYVGQHAVLYQGQYDGEGTIFGEWSIAPVDRGKFMLRLSRDASGHASSEAIEEITPRVSRR